MATSAKRTLVHFKKTGTSKNAVPAEFAQVSNGKMNKEENTV